MKKKYLKKIISWLTVIIFITNPLLSFNTSIIAQESSGSALINVTPQPTPTEIPVPIETPTPVETTVTPTPTVLPIPTFEPTATPSATIIPITETPTPTTSPTPTTTQLQSVPTSNPQSTPAEPVPTAVPSVPTVPKTPPVLESLQNFIKESSSSASAINYAIKLPFDSSYPISLGFGEIPDDPYLQKQYESFGIISHDGIDYDMSDNTNILAVDLGIVLSAGPGIYGTTIVVYHTWGMTYFGHLSSVSVKPGQIVGIGELIGYSGHTGLTTGPHLHFGVKPKNPDLENGFHGMVDPNIYLNPKPQSKILGISDGKKTDKITQKASRLHVKQKDNQPFNFKSNETPEFEISLSDSKFTNKLKQGDDNFKKSVSAVIKYEGLKDEKLSVDLNIDSNKNLLISPKNKSVSRPGKYHITLKIPTDSGEEIIEQDFTWGVLAINTNKSIYLPNDKVYLQMGSLDNLGHTLCGSDLTLEIIDPQGNKTIPDVTQSSTCDHNNVTDNPDYFSYYQVGQKTGTYNINLTNTDNNYSISDSFEVKDSVPFVVERTGATRINPFKSDYKMTIKIRANQDFDGKIIEQIPLTYGVTDKQGAVITTNQDFKNLTWKIKMTSGEEKTIWYEYDPQELSPYLFYLGPLRIVEKNSPQQNSGQAEQVVFTEARQWQIASDLTCDSTGDLNWNSTASWSCGRVPQATDDVYILATDTITVNMSGAVAQSLTMNSPGANNSTNGLVVSTSQSLTVSNNLTFISNTSTSNENQFITLNGSGNLSVGGNLTIPKQTAGTSSSLITFASTPTGTLAVTGTISIASGDSAGRTTTITGLTGNISAAGIIITGGTTAVCTMNSTTGSITTTGGITFGGTAANTRLTTTGAGTINLAGTMSAGGTVAINTGTTLYTTSTSAINGAYTLGNLTVSSGTTTLGAAITVANTLIVTSGTLDVGANDLIVGLSSVVNSGSIKVGGTISQSASATTLVRSSSSGANCIGATGASCAGTPGTIGFGNLTIGVAGTTTTTTINATLAPPTVSVAGTLNITTNATLSAQGTLNVGVNFTKSGIFTANASEVVLNGSGTQILSGAISFYKLTVSNAGGRTITFPASTITAVSNLLTFTGTSCSSLLTLNSSSPGTNWTLAATSTTSLDYLDIYDSTASTGVTATHSTKDVETTGWTLNTNCTFTYSITGTVYGTDETSALGSGITVRVKVDGAGDTYTDTTDVNGLYEVTGITMSAGNSLTIYLDTGGGANPIGATFTRATGATMNNIYIYQNRATTRCDNSNCSLTNDDIYKYDKTGDDDIHANVDNASGGALTIDDDWKLLVVANTFAPGGPVTTTAGGLNDYSGDIEITGGVTLNMAGNNLSVGGAGVGSSSPLRVSGGTYTPGTNTTTFTGTADSTINAMDYYNLTINSSGVIFSAAGTITVTSNLTVTAGTLAMGAENLTVGSTAASGNGRIKVASGATISQTSGTTFIKHGSGGASCIGGVDSDTCTGTAGTIGFNNLTIGDGGTTLRTDIGGTTIITVAGILSIENNATLRPGAITTFILSGTGIPITRLGTAIFDVTTNPGSTIKYTSTSGVTALSQFPDFYNLTIEGTGTFPAGGTDVKNNLTVTAGTLAMGTNNLIVGSTANTNSGSIKIASGATISQSSAGTTTVTSSAAGSNCIGANSADCAGTAGTIGFGNLTIGVAGTTTTTTIAGTNPVVSVAGTLNITTNATLSANGTLNVGGDWTNSGTFTPNFGTVTFNKTSGTALITTGQTKGGSTAGKKFYNVIFGSASNNATFFLAGDLDVDNDLQILTGDTLEVDDGNIVYFNVNVGHDWNNAGTFRPYGGTVTFDGASGSTQTFTGNTGFTGFTATSTGARNLVFTATSTQTIAGAMNLDGGATCDDLIYLQSSSAGSAWNLAFTGTVTNADHLKIQDSAASGASTPITATNSWGVSGNSGWTIDGVCSVVSGPTTDQQMRHGKWFNSGTEQPFTW